MVTVERGGTTHSATGLGDAGELKGAIRYGVSGTARPVFGGTTVRRCRWLLSGALLLIILLNLAASYGMNVWHRVIF